MALWCPRSAVSSLELRQVGLQGLVAAAACRAARLPGCSCRAGRTATPTPVVVIMCGIEGVLGLHRLQWVARRVCCCIRPAVTLSVMFRVCCHHWMRNVRCRAAKSRITCVFTCPEAHAARQTSAAPPLLAPCLCCGAGPQHSCCCCWTVQQALAAYKRGVALEDDPASTVCY
jgi:hypothetical protein